MTPVARLKACLATDPSTWPDGEKRPDENHRWAQIEDFIQSCGVTVCRVETTCFVGNYQWDGKTITASRCDNLLHDFAHYQCAHPSRRFLPDFGLGSGPDSFEHLSLAPGITTELAWEEESYASALGMLWEIHFNLSFQHTLSYHRWNLDRNIKDQLIWLHNHGLTDKGHPTTNLRNND